MTPEITIQAFNEAMKDLLASQKETALLFKETATRFKDTDAKFKDTDAKFKETAIRFKDTDARFKETDKKIKEAFDLFTNQWGRLMESLVEGDLIKLLQQRGIAVDHTSTRVKGTRNGEHYEFDIIAINTTELVITEVKTTLRPDDVRKFEEKLKKVKIYTPEYAPYRIYGAIAYLQEHSQAARMAENDGLLVIKATGSSASIANADDFKPKVW